MRILNRQKLDDLLVDCEGANLLEKLRDFCRRNSSQDPAASPAFEKLIVSSSGMVAWVYGENPALADLLRDVQQGGSRAAH